LKNPQSIPRIITTAFSALLIITATAQADVGDQVDKLIAGDGEMSDLFGFSVALSGTTAIIGSLYDDDNAVDSGAAYLFDTVTGLETIKLIPINGEILEEFGRSVAINATTAIVGSPAKSVTCARSGSAYLFDTATGMQVAELVPIGALCGGEFGKSVSISGTTVVVGAPRDDDTCAETDLLNLTENCNQSGSAYLFDTVTGAQIARLIPDDADGGDLFGTSVAIYGSTVVVGAPGDSENGSMSGSVYLFDANTGLQTAKLIPEDGSSSDLFGGFVAISGTTAIISAIGNDANGSFSGSAYLFDTATGLQIAKLIPNDGTSTLRFGGSVAISGTTALVGAIGDNTNGSQAGSAYLFDTRTGSQITKLLADDGSNTDFFGYAVAISGSTTLIGASRNEGNEPLSGSAYLFESPAPIALASEVTSISHSAGGSQVLVLDGEAPRAGWTYFMLGSVTGTTPGIDFGGGVVLPLNLDVYLLLTLKSPGLGLFNNFRGTLDSAGQAMATFSLPPIADSSLVGLIFNHAYIAGPVIGTVSFASNAVPVTLVM
jgi:hypothetical protein